MIDHHTTQRRATLAHMQTINELHQEKLAAAKAWLRERGRYCLEIPHGTNYYKPAHGEPMSPK